ncbi:GNAT family N-acetyltransferase [Streptomyces lavendulae]|uniref:GNAT family N-acetyltransferase n=1 Tax=Streptomyces lavendulae TaxID=1914 RepID=UPI0036A16037
MDSNSPAPKPSATAHLRRFLEGDSVEDLTLLLHRAYADHAAAGRVFFASYQTPQDTRHRMGKGECWVAVNGNELLGTVTVSAPHTTPAGYPASAGAGSFWQLAVDPSQRGTGLGHRLLGLAESRIAALGSTRVVIDTSSQAEELVDWYRRRGYARTGTWRWGVTNYDSVVLAKDLPTAVDRGATTPGGCGPGRPGGCAGPPQPV